MQSLDIPLTENPTRQKIWRVVVFLAPLILSAGVSALVVRSYVALDTLSGFAPADTEMAVRIIKTQSTAEVLEDKFHGTLLFPNAPFTLDEVSSWSKRGSEVFLGQNAVLGIAIAGKVPQSALNEATALGLVVNRRFGGTYIGLTAPTSTSASIRLPIVMMLPWFNGEALVPSTNIHAPLTLRANSLTITGLGREKPTNEVATADSLANLNVTAEESQKLLNLDVPLVFPGVRAMTNEMSKDGFTLKLGADTDGTAYSITVPDGNLSKEDMESSVTDLYYLNHLSQSVSKDVYTSLDEIVSTSTEKPVTTSDPFATITSITANDGSIVRAAQTPHSLIITNRSVVLDGTGATNEQKNSCLASANQWVSISELIKMLPMRLSTPGMTMIQRILDSKTIAFSKNKTRVCW